MYAFSIFSLCALYILYVVFNKNNPVPISYNLSTMPENTNQDKISEHFNQTQSLISFHQLLFVV